MRLLGLARHGKPASQGAHSAQLGDCRQPFSRTPSSGGDKNWMVVGSLEVERYGSRRMLEH